MENLQYLQNIIKDIGSDCKTVITILLNQQPHIRKKMFDITNSGILEQSDAKEYFEFCRYMMVPPKHYMNFIEHIIYDNKSSENNNISSEIYEEINNYLTTLPYTEVSNISILNIEQYLLKNSLEDVPHEVIYTDLIIYKIRDINCIKFRNTRNICRKNLETLNDILHFYSLKSSENFQLLFNSITDKERDDYIDECPYFNIKMLESTYKSYYSIKLFRYAIKYRYVPLVKYYLLNYISKLTKDLQISHVCEIFDNFDVFNDIFYKERKYENLLIDVFKNTYSHDYADRYIIIYLYIKAYLQSKHEGTVNEAILNWCQDLFIQVEPQTIDDTDQCILYFQSVSLFKYFDKHMNSFSCRRHEYEYYKKNFNCIITNTMMRENENIILYLYNFYHDNFMVGFENVMKTSSKLSRFYIDFCVKHIKESDPNFTDIINTLFRTVIILKDITYLNKLNIYNLYEKYYNICINIMYTQIKYEHDIEYKFYIDFCIEHMKVHNSRLLSIIMMLFKLSSDVKDDVYFNKLKEYADMIY